MDTDYSPWWLWPAIMLASVVSSMAIAMTLPLFFGQKGAKREKSCTSEEQRTISSRPKEGRLDGPLEEEPWCPKLEIKDWSEASGLSGCPWTFDSCQSIEDVLSVIWRRPLGPDLQGAADALCKRVKKVRVARVVAGLPQVTHFAIVYTLQTGAELFGGAPVEHAVGLDLGSVDFPEEEEESSTLRHRRAAISPKKSHPVEAVSIALPSMMPFFRIHDGFGVLLSTTHLPLLLDSPGDAVNGSCFYVQPARGLKMMDEPSGLIKFARVDHACAACARPGDQVPKVIYCEKAGQTFEDDEPLLPFIADTVNNLAGQRVVPPSYMGGPRP